MKTTKYVILLFSLLSVSSFAQTAQEMPLLDRQNPKYDTSMEKQLLEREVIRTPTPQVLEDALDPEVYMVGPGDQFRLFIFGMLENEFDITVLPEGDVFIPTVGKINVKGLNLTRAKEKIKRKVEESYVKSEVSVNLSGLRKFRVYLTGEVNTPGTYFVQGSDRVSDVIEIAGGAKDWADATSVILRHKGGAADTLNLLRFYRQGDKSVNPLLQGGDMIYVAPIDLTKPYIIVESRIEKVLEGQTPDNKVVNEKSTRAIFRLDEGETVIQFLQRISAFSAEIDLAKITLIRDTTEYVIDLLNRFTEYSSFVLKNRDRLIVPNLVSEVYVQGEVLRPGSYVYDVNLTANDYAGKAGVREKSKPSEDIIVIRAATGEIVVGGETIVEKGDRIIVPRKVREDVRDYMAILLPIVSIALSMYAVLKK
ncbi:MAG TPA: polysaccharide export protein [Caldithrix abyssi]|uniref:Polysaccharide export protein n=1 Tax=Caldithrix abyssi TaxID=187145 RepID=A0A7V4WWF8_CALAY|nr:polysaccharide export protein [Caldithrix abyssi]